MLALVGVAVLVVAALAVGMVVVLGGGEDGPGADGPGEPSSSFPAEWDPRVAAIADWVADERDLEFTHPVEVVFLTPEAYQEQIVGDEEAGDEEEVEETVALLRAVGLLQGDVDLAAETEALAGGGSLAFYDPEEEEVYVRGTEITPGVRVTLAHELTHVLQDQHFDLERLGDAEFDRSTVLRALAEGDASRIEAAYAQELSDEERAGYEEETAAGAEAAEEVFDEVSPVLVALFTAPYVLGQGFVDHVAGSDGASAIDEALRHPPSEQELLDPSVRGTDAAEEVPVEVAAPEGAEVLDEDTFGPVSWYLLLSARQTPTAALLALDGWGGDAFVSYRQDGEVCAAVAVTGDDAAATDALHDLVVDWAEDGPPGTAEVVREDDVVELRSCDPGADATIDDDVLVNALYLPLLRTQMRTELLGAGIPDGVTSCAVDRIVEGISADDLGDVETLLGRLPGEVQAAVTACT